MYVKNTPEEAIHIYTELTLRYLHTIDMYTSVQTSHRQVNTVEVHARTHTHTHACRRTLTPARDPSRTHARTHTHTHAHTHTQTHTQVRGGGLMELDISGNEELAVAVAAAGLLERSAATLTRLNVR